MKRLFASVVIVALAALTAPVIGMASAYAGPVTVPGNSPNAKLCQKNGWQNWVRADQTPFISEEDCVSYAAHGGVLTARTALTVLARAYTNLDGVGEFDAAHDVSIAVLTDDNHDGVISPGDHVTLNEYPTTFAATNFGTFGVTSHVVTNVTWPITGSVKVDTDTGAGFQFTEQPGFEGYNEYVVATHAVVIQMGDSATGSGDNLSVGPGAISQPSDLFATAQSNATDDIFLDVDLNVSAPV